MGKHQIEWDAANKQWFCTKCLRTSDHSNKQDAELELNALECTPPDPHV